MTAYRCCEHCDLDPETGLCWAHKIGHGGSCLKCPEKSGGRLPRTPGVDPELVPVIRQAAEWLAAAGYPIEFRMPDLPPPPALWEALVDVIHEDKNGIWHGKRLSREETESWLRDEMGDDRA